MAVGGGAGLLAAPADARFCITRNNDKQDNHEECNNNNDDNDDK